MHLYTNVLYFQMLYISLKMCIAFPPIPGSQKMLPMFMFPELYLGPYEQVKEYDHHHSEDLFCITQVNLCLVGDKSPVSETLVNKYLLVPHGWI